MTITIYPEGYIRDQMHRLDLEKRPERHRLTKDSYSQQEMREMCVYCADYFKWSEHLIYSAEHDRYYRKGK